MAQSAAVIIEEKFFQQAAMGVRKSRKVENVKDFYDCQSNARRRGWGLRVLLETRTKKQQQERKKFRLKESIMQIIGFAFVVRENFKQFSSSNVPKKKAFFRRWQSSREQEEEANELWWWVDVARE